MTAKDTTDTRGGSILEAILWIMILGALLAWLPVLGPFIAGLVGGRKAGGLLEAWVACFLPAVLFSLFLVGWSFFGNFPLWRAVHSSRQVMMLAATNLPLLAGATVGAAWGE
jgi:hypothetical protein